MPTWKKIVVSGSGISQLTNDANYLAAGGAFSASVDSRLDVSETLSGSAHTQRAALDAAQTTANTNLSSSTATALRSEYVASVASLSGSAKTQREAQKSAADARLAAIETFTGSLDASFATDAEVTALSGAAETRRNQLDSAQTTANTNLSSSAHSQREAIKGLATSANNSLSSSTSTALRAEYVALDGAQTTANTNLSSSTATALRAEYVALDGAQTTANTNLSSSAAGALRTEYVAGDTALSSSLNTRIVSLESGGGTAGLSASAHTQREAIKGLATTANNSLSSSKSIALRAEYVAADTALSSSQKTYIDAKVAGIVNSAPATLDTLDELAAALNDDANFSASIATSIGNRLLTSTHNTYSGSAATALRAEYVAGDTALSSSTATALRAEYVAGDSALSSSAATALRAEYVAGDSALSASAHGDRVAKIAVLSASAHTARATGATSASSHAQRVALINTLSSSAATANDSSAITVRNLVGQTVVASSFEGDGSSLTNITVDQNATVASAFTSVTSHAVTHNFGTKNVLVQVYDDNDQVIIPASITSTNTNTSTVTFDGASTGIVVVARGGHVVSGSIPYANLINTPSASFSSRIDALSGSGHAQRLAVVSALSSSVDAHLDANITTLSASAHAARAGGATSASAHTQRIAVVNIHSSSAASALRSEYVAADTALSSSQKTYIDAKVAGIVDSAPGTLDTLNELAAALNDDPNFSASIATSIGNRLLTSTHNTYSSSAAGALRTEYVAGDTALSSSAHGQREAIKGLATAANNSLSSSTATALRTEYVAGDAAISGALNTRIVALEGAGTTAALSSSAHTQREAIKGLATSANSSLSSSTATALRAEYVALDGAQTTANTNLSSSTATALRAEYVALDGAQTTANTNLSSSAHTQREAVKGLATTANNSLSSSTATALRAEWLAQDSALSASQNTYINAKVAGLVNSAPATLDTLDELAAALNDDPNFSASIATSIGNKLATATFNTYSGSAAGAIRSEYVAGDTALSSSLNTRIVSLEGAGTTSALSASAHTQREAIKGLATSANNSLSSSTATGLRAEYVALDGAQTTANTNLSSSTATALRAEYVALDGAQTTANTNLSSSAHTQRIALIPDVSVYSTTSDVNSLSSSTATALRTEYVAGDAALSSSAHTQREAIKGLATSANNSLSSSTATALRAEYVAGDSALSASSHSDRIAKVAALSASAHSARGSISSTFTIAGTAGSDSFATGQTLTFAGTGNEIETTVTNNQVQIGITTNPTLSGNVIVTGDLTVQGDTFENQVTNLNVEDRFILLNSGSTSGDVGIIFGGSDGVANVGSGIFWDSPSNVFGFADGITATATSATHDAKIGAITTSTAAPTAAPTFQGVGSIHVKTDSEDVYIYTAD
jgi:hypothetical protein